MIVAKRASQIKIALAMFFTLIIAMWALIPVKAQATNYTATLSTTSWESEENDSTATADRILVNTTYYGNLDMYGDDDYYRVSITSNGYVELTFNHEYITDSEECWNVSLLDSEGNKIMGSGVKGNDEKFTFVPMGLPAGTYYVKIDNSWLEHSDVTYNFQVKFTASSVWETEFNDQTSAADEISVNTTYYGNLDEYRDYDYYWFRINDNGYIKLNFNHEYIPNTETCWNVSLLDSEGDGVINFGVQGNDESFTYVPIGLPAGTYYVKIDNSWIEHSDVTYNFQVKFTASSVWETEFNNQTATADEISVNTTYYGNLDEYGDSDYYWLKTNTKGYANITFKHPYISGSDAYWIVKLLDSDGNTVIEKYVKGNQKSVTLGKKLISSETYYVQIYNSWIEHSDVTYNFKVNFASDLKLSLPATKYSYAGKERKPKVTVKYGGAALTEGTHYTVSYSNNKYPGTATVTVEGKGQYIGTFKKNFTIKNPAVAPKTVKAKLYGHDDFSIKWSGQRVSGHTVKYKVQYKKYGGKWATISSNTTKTSLKKANLDDGKRYAFKVTPYVTIDGKNYYTSSKSTPYTYTLKKVSTPKVSKADSLYVSVKWANISGESGYQIYRSKYSNKNFTKVKSVSSKYSSAKIKTTRNKTYYYKVRAYKKVDGKIIYGPWSSPKKYKLK